jgi:RHS repeat-associated protein
MGYDSIHNITTKNQLHTIVQPSAQAITQKKTTYDWTYQYNPPGATSTRPHAPNHIGERAFTYDANGNQLGWTHDQNGTNRTIVWDEDNRIQTLADQGHVKYYKYDDQGQRIIKRGPQGETVYVNQFYTQRPGATGTKHIYAGTTRLVSKLVKQDTPNGNPQGATPYEKDLYFYHPDHLGTSNYITDTQGKLYEHLEYFPFGEGWVEENSNTQRTPYLFTAKELDEETGLYYFGARYYDPRTSVWQSADPILGKYLPNAPTKPEEVVKLLSPTVQNPSAHFDLPGMGGVYHSININLFAYASINPLRVVDPDGAVNFLVGVGVTAAAPTGAETSGGIVVNPGLFGQKADAGVFAAVGPTVGVNVSGDVFIGIVKGEIENVSGETVNQNIGIGPLSITIFHDPKNKGEVIGGTIGLGPGATPVGYSGAYDVTGTLTVRDVVKWISGLFGSKPEPPKVEPKPEPMPPMP